MNASIRNIALASGLTLVSLLGLATTAQAQLTGATNLKVTIVQDCKITKSPTGLDESVNSYAAITAKSLQSPLTVVCNGNNFFINAKSASGGALKTSPTSTGPFIPYTVVVANDDMGTGTFLTTATALSTTDTQLVAKTGYSSGCASTGCSVNLTWALGSPSAGLPIGVYQDTITYTLSAN